MIKIGDEVRFMVKYDDEEKIRYGCIKIQIFNRYIPKIFIFR